MSLWNRKTIIFEYYLLHLGKPDTLLRQQVLYIYLSQFSSIQHKITEADMPIFHLEHITYTNEALALSNHQFVLKHQIRYRQIRYQVIHS